MQGIHFYTTGPTTSENTLDWTHVTLNYIGPNEGQGIRLYQNGVLVGNDTEVGTNTYSMKTGKVVLGKCYNNQQPTNNVDVDELMFFEEVLSQSEVEKLYNNV